MCLSHRGLRSEEEERLDSTLSLSDYPDLSKIRTRGDWIQVLRYWMDGYE